MKIISWGVFSLLFFSSALAGTKDSVNTFILPDSVKAVGFISTVRGSAGGIKKFAAGIRNSDVSIFLEAGKKSQSVVFTIPAGSSALVSGLDVKGNKQGRMEWAFPWDTGNDYKLYISSAGDSAGNFLLYSGYIFLPVENKWKLIGTCKISGRWNDMGSLQAFASPGTTGFHNLFSSSWVQRNNGKWFNLRQDASAEPVIMPFTSIDSIRQSAVDRELIAKSIKDVPMAKDGIYYWLTREGTGKVVSVTDTVTVFYKGYIFGEGTIFDQTGKEPRTFPLGRLIRGWQVGLAGTKVGGKIKLLIPSVHAYGIRTRGAKIPPNSILVFEIEVLDARAPMN